MRHIFGPVPSRRFGLSLGIDLSPHSKSCNFDCLYCELDPAKPTDTIQHPAPPQAIVQEVHTALKRHPNIEVLTLTANGEPTLYPYLDDLIKRLEAIKGDKELLILSNASTIHRPEIQEALARLDIVKLSLDCATPKCFRRLDRPLKGIELHRIIDAIRSFRRRYHGLLVIEILVVRGINDTVQEFEALGEVLRSIKPDRIDLGTIDRPPAYRVEPLAYAELFELSKHLHGLPVSIVARTHHSISSQQLDREEILHLLAMRPLTKEDLSHLLTPQSFSTFKQLLDEGSIERKRVGKLEFFEPKR